MFQLTQILNDLKLNSICGNICDSVGDITDSEVRKFEDIFVHLHYKLKHIVPPDEQKNLGFDDFDNVVNSFIVAY